MQETESIDTYSSVDSTEDFTVEQPLDTAANVIDAAELGLLPGNNDAAAALEKAFAVCRERTPCTLVLKKGIYRFDSGRHITMNDMRNFIFDASGSEFLFSVPKGPFFTIRNCSHIVVKNLICDWDWQISPLASIGLIKSVEGSYKSFEIAFADRDKVNPSLDMRCFTPLTGGDLSVGGQNGQEFGAHFLSGEVLKTGKNTLRLFPCQPNAMHFLKAGQVYMVRHYVYDAGCFSMFDNEHLTLDGIVIYSAPGHGFLVGGHQHHWQLLHCKITKRPGTSRCVTVTADGHHVSNSNGYFKMEYCDFGFNGDDCVNIHDNIHMSFQRTSNKSIRLQDVMKWQNPFDIGDLLEFRNHDLSPTGFSSRIEKVQRDDEHEEAFLVLADPLPGNLELDGILFNRAYNSSHYILRHNFFHQNRARGVLAQAGNGLIENNRFMLHMGPALQMECGCEQRWAEGQGIRDLMVRDNVFESCDTSHWFMAAVYLGCYLPGGRTDYPIFENIIFEKNTFIDLPEAALYLSSCRHVTVRENILINVCRQKHTTGSKLYGYTVDSCRVAAYSGTIMFDHASCCVVEKNRLLHTVPVKDTSLFSDPCTTNQIRMTENDGFTEYEKE